MGVSDAMKAHLAGTLTVGVFVTITAKDGDVIRVWSGTRDKVVSGQTFTAYPIAPSKLQAANGLKADNLDITSVYSGLFNSVTLRAKKWQGARVEYQILNYKDFTMGYAERRICFLGKTEVGKQASKVELNSLSSKLNEPWGRTCTKDCDVDQLGDSRCGVDLTGNTVDGYKIKISADIGDPVDNRQQFPIVLDDFIKPSDHGVSTAPDGFYKRGTIKFDSGYGNYEALILNNIGNALTLYLPLPFDPVTDNTVTLTAGCDRSIGTCRDKYNNAKRNKGFPYLPGRSRILHIPD